VLTILATYRCTAACEHCCFDSNPFIQQRLALSDILCFIDEAARFKSLEAVVFSGGECFLLGDDLVTSVQHASHKNLMTRCVTNGYWAKSLTAGRQRLLELRDAGLKELNISTGDFHQQYVPLETVVNAACLGVELGLTTLIVVEMQRNRRVTARQVASDPRIAQLLNNQPAERFKMIESPWMPMDLQTNIQQPSEALINRHNVHLRGGCDSILATLVLTPDRQVGICCGLTREMIPELNLDYSTNSLDVIVTSAGRDFFKIWLFVDGPERILAWAASKNPLIEWENRYSHRCHTCLAVFDDPVVRETVATHYRERINDVLLRYDVLLRQQDALVAAAYG
jgi:hypothetical protein